MTDAPDPLAVAWRVTNALDTLGIAHTIGGSIASSMAGEPRSIIDVDIVAAIGERHVSALVKALGDEFYVDPEALSRAVSDRQWRDIVGIVRVQGPRLDLEYLAEHAPRWG